MLWIIEFSSDFPSKNIFFAISGFESDFEFVQETLLQGGGGR